MSRLAEGLANFFGRVEIIARGADGDRRAAEEALANHRPLEAREAARDLLRQVPDSPVAMALWADAAEEVHLDGEVAEALTELAKLAPWRGDVWLRLGAAYDRLGQLTDARSALERAIETASAEDRVSVRAALLLLADQDLRAGDPARAFRWLDRVPAGLAEQADPGLALRRVEAALDLGAPPDRIAAELEGLESVEVTDGRAALVRARALRALDQAPEEAEALALRALMLDADGAEAVVAELMTERRDPALTARVREVVAAFGDVSSPRWQAAFARAEGRTEDALQALTRAIDEGPVEAPVATLLVGLALEGRDARALGLAHQHGVLPAELEPLWQALRDEEADEVSALQALEKVAWAPLAPTALEGEPASVPSGFESPAVTWARSLRRSIYSRWLTSTAWSSLLEVLHSAARELDRMDVLLACEALLREPTQPLRVAIVGEFNAGKSTFINAFLGEDVAPTGVVPTTATLHWVSFAPDPFARVVIRGAADRLVPHAELKRALRSAQEEQADVDYVSILSPIERLKRVEVLDTPGFNAPDPEHIRAARRAFEEAHVVIWLLDAVHPLKETERAVLAEIRDLDMPVQILVNKADRLDAAALEKVMAHVDEGLREAELSSLSPPLSLSAKLALAGRMGDDDALQRSNWSVVERTFAERVVDRADELRSRAIARKARGLTQTLLDEAAEQANAEAERARHQRQIESARHRAAAQALGDRAALSMRVEKELEVARRLLIDDLRPLSALPTERLDDPSLRNYVQARAVFRLGPSLKQALVHLLALDTASVGEVAETMDIAMQAVVAGAVSGAAVPASWAKSSWVGLAEAAIDAFAQILHRSYRSVPETGAAQRRDRLADFLAAVEEHVAGESEPSAGERESDGAQDDAREDGERDHDPA